MQFIQIIKSIFCKVKNASPVNCGLGLYSLSASMTCQECPLGYYTNKTGSEKCLSCPEGHFCPGGLNEPQICPSGTFSTIGFSSCFSCQFGYYNTEIGQSSCKVGYFY